MSLDSFITGYINCALWSSVDDNGDPLDYGCCAADIAPETYEQMRKDCEAFYTTNLSLIEDEERQFSSDNLYQIAGSDFWLTRCGHGAGFWDGDWPKHGDKLTEQSRAFGNVDLYVGDDGLIYA